VFELKPAFDILFQRPDALALVTDEMFGETRRAAAQLEVEGEAVMEGVEHLGKYVYDMLSRRMRMVRGVWWRTWGTRRMMMLKTRSWRSGVVGGIWKSRRRVLYR
jgi:hypothetical protein